ncbi:MAG: response regulator transcription factor [Bacteroidetes bacterium]|nr:response regulator transcription factor [Bacteroidota bacterium]
MIRCIIIDDKPLAIDVLAAYTTKVPWLNLVFSTRNPLEALEYLRGNPVDLIFLDIQMPELNGLQLIKTGSIKIPVILTTAYSEYALDGYALDVVDYLLKPIPFERFYQAVEKARNRTDTPQEPSPHSLFVKTSHKIQRVSFNEILYIEARQNYISIETTTGRIMSLQNIKGLEEKLPAALFIRVHKSYIVALDKINTIEKSRIFIGDNVIPIGESYREHFFRRLDS